MAFVVGMPDKHLGAGQGLTGQDVLDMEIERERYAFLSFHEIGVLKIVLGVERTGDILGDQPAGPGADGAGCGILRQ